MIQGERIDWRNKSGWSYKNMPGVKIHHVLVYSKYFYMLKLVYPFHTVPQKMLFLWKTKLLQWRHNEPNGVSNHRPLGCLLNRLCRRRSKKTLKLRVTDLCEGNSPVTGEFPAQRASNTKNVSIWWRHHDLQKELLKVDDVYGKPLRTVKQMLARYLFRDRKYWGAKEGLCFALECFCFAKEDVSIAVQTLGYRDMLLCH